MSLCLSKYRNNIALDSSQKVIKIEAKEGQLVKKGDLLLELDSSDYQTKLEKQLINMENANLTLNHNFSKLSYPGQILQELL